MSPKGSVVISRVSARAPRVLAAIFLLAGMTAAAMTWGARTAEPVLSAAPVAGRPIAAQGGAKDARVEVVRITIRPTGFDPAEIRLPRGRFMLAVDNRAGLDELTFRLDREAGGRLYEVRMPREQLAWRKVIDPAPGSYILTEAGHPEWTCRVSVSD